MVELEFHAAPMLEIIAAVRRQLAGGAAEVGFEVLDPDHARGRYAGEPVELGGVHYLHRPLRVWVELADRLGLRLRTPRPTTPPRLELRFERLDPRATLDASGPDPTERYGTSSPFARVSKLDDPGFVIDLTEALERCALARDARILDLGVNTGDELALIRSIPALADTRLTGIDHSASAIAVARARFPDATLHEADLTALPALALPRFDLVLSVGTLQSPGVDDRELLRRIVQHHLTPGGAVVLGMPNCRYLDGEVRHGARVKNFGQPELGLLLKDLTFYRKYLQQHRRQVFVTGKHYVFVTGVAVAPAGRGH